MNEEIRLKLLDLLQEGVPCHYTDCKLCKYNKADQSIYDCDIQRLCDFLLREGVRVEL